MIRAVPNFWAHIRILVCAVVFTCTFAYSMPAGAAPFAQAVTGTITGQVLSLDNVALPNVRLASFSQAPGTPNRTKLAEFQSDAQGRYAVQVPAGQVWVEFLTQDISGQSFWGYDNLPVNVAAGQTVSGQDFRVAIRVVSAPPAAVPPVTAPPAPVTSGTSPGMPSTGAGPDLWLLPVAALALLMMVSGLLQRRRDLL